LQRRHGGKVAAGALALTAAIIYKYYESGRSKTNVEEGLNNRMVIEPYEVNEIRFLNNLTPAVYEALSVACLNHFASSPSSSEQGRTTTTLIIAESPHPFTQTSFLQKWLFLYAQIISFDVIMFLNFYEKTIFKFKMFLNCFTLSNKYIDA
jgi:hypothetical protein